MELNQEGERQETVIEMEEFPRQRQINFGRQNEEGDALERNMRRIQTSDWVIFVAMMFLWLFCVLMLIFMILVAAKVIKCEIQ